jgi:amidohydrolase
MIENISKKLAQKLISLRRDLHKHPELSWQEEHTSRRICNELDALGIRYRSGIAKYGIIAEIPGEVNKPFIALRADMDALPIHEETGLEFSSTNSGVMHACGHDGHMSILVGAATLLLENAPLPCPIRLIFQPAEEDTDGARKMIEGGALDDVEMIFGGHLDRMFDTGTYIITEGAVNASTDSFNLKITGQGTHGARPNEGVDVIVVGSLIVVALQSLVSRLISPAEPAVVTVGQFTAGSAPNILPSEANLFGTIRSHNPEIRAQLINGLSKIATSIASPYGAKVEVNISQGSPPLINTEEMVNLAKKAALNIVSTEKITSLKTLNMGGEDFSEYLEKVPGSYIRYGAKVIGKESYPAHTSRFDFDESAMIYGAAYLAEIAKLACEKIAS